MGFESEVLSTVWPISRGAGLRSKRWLFGSVGNVLDFGGKAETGGAGSWGLPERCGIGIAGAERLQGLDDGDNCEEE